MAHDGPSAFAKIRDTHPEMLLLDIGLPGMDGYRVGKPVREESEFDDVLLVALTGYGQDDLRDTARLSPLEMKAVTSLRTPNVVNQ